MTKDNVLADLQIITLDILTIGFIIKDEERLNGCSSSTYIYMVTVEITQKLPSLGRVAVVFFCAIFFLVGFRNDYRHCVLPYMKS